MLLDVIRHHRAFRHDGQTGVLGRLQGFADQGLISRFAVPERVLFVDALERTSVGKIDKKVLREKYRAVV